MFQAGRVECYHPSGTVLFDLGGIKFTDANLALATAAVARILVMSGSFYALLVTTDFGAMIAGLLRMRIPYSIAFGVGLTLQLLPLIIQEFADIMDARAQSRSRTRSRRLGRSDSQVSRDRRTIVIAIAPPGAKPIVCSAHLPLWQ